MQNHKTQQFAKFFLKNNRPNSTKNKNEQSNLGELNFSDSK